MKDYQQHNLTHTQPARNPLAAPHNTPKPNFATRPKRNFDQVNRSDNQQSLIFVVPCIMLYSGEISPTRCNYCVFIRNGFTLHVSGDNLTHQQEYNAVYGQLRVLTYFGVSRLCLQILLYQVAAFVLYSFLLVFLYW